MASRTVTRTVTRSLSPSKRNPSPKKKGSTKKKKKKKIVEDPRIVRLLHNYAEAGDLDKFVSTVEAPENKNQFDWAQMAGEALVTAAEKGHANIVAYLLQQPTMKPNYGNGKALQRAALNNHMPVLRLLLGAKGADVNAKETFTEFTALQLAAGAGHLEVVDFLRRCGADLDQQCHALNCGIQNGWGAIHFAADAGKTDVVRYLVEEGATVDLLTAGKETAAALAAERGHFDIVRFLVANGANVHAQRRGLSLVQWAAYRGQAETVQYLVACGAEPDWSVKTTWLPDNMTLEEVMKREFSSPLWEKIDLAVYRGKKGQRERAAHRRLLLELRWEEAPAPVDPLALNFDAEPAPPEIVSLPPHIVNIILSYEDYAHQKL